MRANTAAYALPQFVIALVTLALVNFTPSFYASEVGVGMGSLSGLILLTRASDVVTDPIIGWLSDRTKTRLGRRKPWMLAGVPVFLLGMWKLFHPGEGDGGLHFLIWYAVVFFGLTMIQLPYSSWGAEMSRDYDRRTRIFTLREVVGSLGSATAIGVAVVLALGFGILELGPVLHVIAILLLVTTPVLVIASFRAPALIDAPLPDSTLRTGFRVWNNRPFLWLLAGVLFLFAGITPGGAMTYFLFDNVLGRPDTYGVVLLLEFVAAGVGVVLWGRLAERIAKGRTLALALLWFGGFTALLPLAVDVAGFNGALAVAILRSFALGAALSLPFSIFGDTVDVDTRATGRERTGLHVGVAGVVIKLALTIGIALSFAIPGWFGFDPTLDTNTARALFSVEAVWAWLPGLLWLPAIWLFWNFPLSPDEAAENREAIQAEFAVQAGAPVL